MRAALYARFSSDLQSAASIPDQFAACRRHAARLGATVVAEFSDAAISGASTVNRPGLMGLMAAAQGGTFDVVIAEALDRLTRSGGDAWDIFEDLAGQGVAIDTLSEGRVEEMAIGLKGTMNALQLREIGRKTRRGQAGVARDGRHTGGRTYGYKIRRELDAKGEVLAGLREIVPDEAARVREIFTRYAAGESPRAIASDFNVREIPGPRGGPWNASTINGNAARGNGVLHNELYRGIIVWGRHAWTKDRRTSKRRQRAADPSEIVRQEAPQFRIVDEDLWRAVQARWEATAEAVKLSGPSAARRPPRLLSGLMRCGRCGAGMATAGPDHRYRCAGRIERGLAFCDMTRSAKADDVERRVLACVQTQLLHPAVVEAAMREYHQARAETQKAGRMKRTGLDKELAEVKRRAARLLDQVETGDLPGSAVRERLIDLEARRAEIEADLARLDAEDGAAGQVVTLHPSAPAKWAQLVESLQQALAADTIDANRDQARQILRQTIQAVRVHPKPDRGEYELEIEGDLGVLLNLGCSGSKVKVGAGTRSQRDLMSIPVRLAG